MLRLSKAVFPRSRYLECHGVLVIMEKKMETTIYYLGFRVT